MNEFFVKILNASATLTPANFEVDLVTRAMDNAIWALLSRLIWGVTTLTNRVPERGARLLRSTLVRLSGVQLNLNSPSSKSLALENGDCYH